MSAAALLDAPASAGSGHWLDDGPGAKLDRLPRLADALNDVARALTENLSTVLASAGEVTFHTLETTRIDRLLDRRGGKPFFAIAQAPGWNTPVALQFDQLFVAVAVHSLFGGDEDEFEFPERTSLTALENRIASLMAEQIFDALSKGFAETIPTTFTQEPIKPKPDTTPLGKGLVPALVATFVLHAVGQPVELDIAIPQSAFDPFIELLAESTDAVANVDPRWSEKLEAEINRAHVILDAHLMLPSITLGDIASLKIGQVLNFETGAGSDIKLSCKNTELFRCDLGQSDGCYSLKITEVIVPVDPSSHKDR